MLQRRLYNSTRYVFYCLFASLVFPGSIAWAKTSQDLKYEYKKVWPTAVRFLRIDSGLRILEKDKETGYVLFELSDEGKTFQGSMELVRRSTDQAYRVEVILQIKDRPSYMEMAMLDKMRLKIREELGLPQIPPPKEKKVEHEKEKAEDSKDKDRTSKPQTSKPG